MVGDAAPDSAQLNGQGQDHHISWFLSALRCVCFYLQIYAHIGSVCLDAGVFVHNIKWVGGVCVKMHVCLCINGWVEECN